MEEWEGYLEAAAKKKTPNFPLNSTKGDQDTERVILRKKPSHRLMFDFSDSSDPIPIRPNRILAEALPTANEVSCQTSRTLCTVISRSFPRSVDIGPVHTYPDIFESATFLSGLKNFLVHT